jgi:hypothetical protein
MNYLNANHLNMCKFPKKEEIGYQRVIDALEGLFDSASMAANKAALEERAVDESPSVQR